MLELVLEFEKGSRESNASQVCPPVDHLSPCTQHTRPSTATRVLVKQRMWRLIPEVWMELQDHFLISVADVCRPLRVLAPWTPAPGSRTSQLQILVLFYHVLHSGAGDKTYYLPS